MHWEQEPLRTWVQAALIVCQLTKLRKIIKQRAIYTIEQVVSRRIALTAKTHIEIRTMIYKREETIYSIAEKATLWRVISGVVRLDQLESDSKTPTAPTSNLVVLAIAGDLIGVESLC